MESLLNGVKQSSGFIMGGETALVLGYDAPGILKLSARMIKTTMGNFVQICDGQDDDVKINAAIEATGCSTIRYTDTEVRPASVRLVGNFITSNEIVLPSYVTLDLTDAVVKLADNSNCNVVTVTSGFYSAGGISYRAHIKGGTIDQNGQNQSSGYAVVWRGYRGSLRGTMIRNGYGACLRVEKGSSTNSFENVFEGLMIFDWGSTSGMSLQDGATDNLVHNCIIAKNLWQADQGYAIYVSAGGNTFSCNHFYWGYCSIYVQNKSAIGIFGNYFNGISNAGGSPIIIAQTGSYVCSHVVISNNYFFTYVSTEFDSHIKLVSATQGCMTDITINGNIFGSTAVHHCVASTGAAAPENCAITGNAMDGGCVQNAVDGEFINSVIKDNSGYIHHGEKRTGCGDLIAGNVNDFAFAWQNPENQQIMTLEVMVDVTTPGGTADSVLDVGSSTTASGHSNNLVSGMDLNTASINVYNTTRVKLDANGGTTDHVTGEILVQNAASLAGKYYIEYMGV